MKKDYIFITESEGLIHSYYVSADENKDYHEAMKDNCGKGRLITILLKINGKFTVIWANGKEVQVTFK